MNTPRPRAFRLEGGAIPELLEKGAPDVELRAEPPPPAPDETEAAIEIAQAQGVARRWRPSLASLIWTGLGGLVSLAIGLWVDRLVESLWAKAQGFGWLGLVFAALALAGVLGLGLREALALARQRRIVSLHIALETAHAADDRDAARAAVARLVALYADRPETYAARAQVESAARQIVDGRDLVEIAERALVKPLDVRARAEVAAASRRVSLVTALSPRAIFDVVFVAAQVIWLTRRVAEIYGGRPGLLGFLRIARSVGAHLAWTGGMAVGDTMLQGLVGHGVAAKISARMGEGVLNGVLTARVGLSALAVCRPAPFHAAKPPTVNAIAPFLFGKDG